MKVRFLLDRLRRLETDAQFTDGLPAGLVKAFRKRMNLIRNAENERDLYELKSNRCERLQGNRGHQFSIRLNDQWRLIFELEGEHPNKTLVVVSIEDYH